MPTGVVKKIVDDKGFGFLRPDDKGKDVFFHHSAVADDGFGDLTEGCAVEYTLNAGETPKGKGPRAASVKLVP